MPVYSLIIWLLIGLVAGALASSVMKTHVPPYGIVGDIVAGILGAIVGGYLFALLGVSADGGLIGSIITAFVGALIVLWIIRQIRRTA